MRVLFAIWSMIRSKKWVVVCLSNKKENEIEAVFFTSGNVNYKEYFDISKSMLTEVQEHDIQCSAVREANELLGNK